VTVPSGGATPPRPVAVTVALSVVLVDGVIVLGFAVTVVVLANGVIQVLLVQLFTRLAMLTLPRPTASL
jgi:hypothetical protein